MEHERPEGPLSGRLPSSVAFGKNQWDHEEGWEDGGLPAGP